VTSELAVIYALPVGASRMNLFGKKPTLANMTPSNGELFHWLFASN
jgi:hypothetical protein